MKEAVKQHARDEFRDDVWDELAANMRYVATDFADEGGEDKLEQLVERARQGERPRRQPRLLPRRAAGRVLDDRRRARQAAERREGLDAPDRREAVRPRPRLGARPERDARGALHRGPDLPHRPLPRQGNGPEHAGAAVRERHLRADLEPAVRRPRADHRRRVDRDRGARRLLRVRGRDPRHLPEPPAAAARPDGDGAADRLHRRVGAEREGEGAARAAHARPEVGRARAVRARLHRGRGGSGLPRGGGRRAGLDDRDVRRGEALRRQLALGGHAVLRAHGQAARAPRDDDRDPVQARSAPAVRGDLRRGAAPERAARPRAAGRGRLARDRREGPRPGHADPHRPHGLPLRRRVPHRRCRRRTSG